MGRARRKAVAQPSDNPATWLPVQWHPSRLPPDLMERLRAARTHVGHLGRLRSALARADHGEPLTVVALGNSVTSDFAGAVGTMQERFQLGYVGKPALCRGKCVQLGWLLPIFRFLTENTNLHASAAVNVGQAARYVDNYLDCTLSIVPQEADIIFLDGVNGMSPITGNHYKPTEKLIRRLLMLPHQPAIVIMHWLDWCACAANCSKTELRVERHLRGACYTVDGLRQSYSVALKRETLAWSSLATHYNLSVLSMAHAFHPLAGSSQSPLEASHPSIGTIGADASNVRYWAQWPLSSMTRDGLHPKSCKSSWQKCRYTMMVASMVTTFVADVRANRSGMDHEQSPLPVSCAPLRTQASERNFPVERCFGWGVDRRVPPPVASSSMGWRVTSLDTVRSFNPPPHCKSRRGQASPQYLGPCPKSKPGMTAFAPGSVVAFELPLATSVISSRDSSGQTTVVQPHRQKNASLTLTYLSSYEGMGVATVSCMSTLCDCEPMTLDGHSATSETLPPAGLVSVWERASRRMVIRDGATTCIVRVVVQNWTRSGGHKFKLGTITIRWPSSLVPHNGCK